MKRVFFAFLLSVVCHATPEKTIWDINETSIETLWGRVLFSHAPVVTPPSPTLIGGSVPNMADFPATSFTGGCTTTAVGSRVAIIAAHCTTGMNGSISFPIGASRYTAKCTDAEKYRRNSTADWSLCKTSKDIEGIEFETINLDENHLAVGDKVMLGGYGCTDVGGKGGIDGQFRIGLSEITNLPNGTSNDIVTKKGAALCFGDSGGAAWSLNPDGTRNKLISVNSRGNISDTSYLSATHTEMFREFIDSWVEDNSEVRICGYHADARDCRGEQPKEPVYFEMKNSPTVLKVTVRPGAIRPDALKNSLLALGF